MKPKFFILLFIFLALGSYINAQTKKKALVKTSTASTQCNILNEFDKKAPNWRKDLKEKGYIEIGDSYAKAEAIAISNKIQFFYIKKLDHYDFNSGTILDAGFNVLLCNSKYDVLGFFQVPGDTDIYAQLTDRYAQKEYKYRYSRTIGYFNTRTKKIHLTNPILVTFVNDFNDYFYDKDTKFSQVNKNKNGITEICNENYHGTGEYLVFKKGQLLPLSGTEQALVNAEKRIKELENEKYSLSNTSSNISSNISIISKTNIEKIRFNGSDYGVTYILNHTGSFGAYAPQDVLVQVYNKNGKLIKESNKLSYEFHIQDNDFPITINLQFEQDYKIKSASFVIWNNGQINLEK